MELEKKKFEEKANFLQSYKAKAINILEEKNNRPLTEKEINNLTNILRSRLKNDRKIRLINNDKNTSTTMLLLNLINWIYSGEPILTGYGVLYKNQRIAHSFSADMLIDLSKERNSEKKEMFKHINDEDKTLFNLHYLIQIVIKLINNSYFGIANSKACILFNEFIGPSITYTGYISISTVMLFLESLLTDSNKFNSFDELFNFLIYNKNTEKNFDVETIIDEHNKKFAIENYKLRLFRNCDFELNCDQVLILNEFLDKCDDSFKIRLFYKNNFIEFLDNEYIKNLLENCFHEKFLDGNSPPDEIVESLNEFTMLIFEFVATFDLFVDRSKRIHTLKRKTVLVVDTDSVFVRVSDFKKKFLEFFEIDNANEIKVKLNINNILVYVVSKSISKILKVLLTNMNVLPEYHNFINMKNEFYFSKIMLTKNKKSYAGMIEAQEGKILSPPKKEIKGLQIKKVSTNKITREYFENIIINDILKSENVDVFKIFDKYNLYKEKVFTEMTNERSTVFTKPTKFNRINSYKEPYTQAAVKGTIIWNAIYKDNQIREFEKINILKLKPFSLEEIQTKLTDQPDIFNIIKETIYEDENLKKYGFEYISLPKKILKIPEWIIQFMDLDDVIEQNTTPATPILEAVGFSLIPSNSKLQISSFIDI